MLKNLKLRKYLPAGLVGGAIALAALLPAGPLAALFAGYSFYGYGGILNSGPGVDALAFQENVFVEGQDRALYYRTTTPSTGTSTNWVRLGGVVVSDPGATQLPNGDVFVAIRGQDNAVWYMSRVGGVWGTFKRLGGVTVSGIEVDNGAAAGAIDVWIKGQDNAVWGNRTLDMGVSWLGWVSLGGVTLQDVGAISTGLGNEDLFIRGQDNAIWWRASGSSAWTSLGGVLVTGAGVASCSVGHMDIFAVGQDLHLWTRGTTNSGATWSAWSQLPGIWSSDPGAVCRPGTNTIDIYARGKDFALWELTTTFGS